MLARNNIPNIMALKLTYSKAFRIIVTAAISATLLASQFLAVNMAVAMANCPNGGDAGHNQRTEISSSKMPAMSHRAMSEQDECPCPVHENMCDTDCLSMCLTACGTIAPAVLAPTGSIAHRLSREILSMPAIVVPAQIPVEFLTPPPRV